MDVMTVQRTRTDHPCCWSKEQMMDAEELLILRTSLCGSLASVARCDLGP